jgi:multidrug transporter EmrE-like cation transporter
MPSPVAIDQAGKTVVYFWLRRVGALSGFGNLQKNRMNSISLEEPSSYAFAWSETSWIKNIQPQNISRGGFVNVSWTNALLSAGFFVIYVITSCFGLYLIKAAEGWKTPAFVTGFVLYAAGAVIWMAILRRMPLSFAFPIAAGSLMIGTTLTGVFFLSENVTAWHIAGAFMIITGIALIATNR